MQQHVPPFHRQSFRFEQAAVFLAGIALILSGTVHVAVWALDGDSLSGPISWRKPILFGLSAGVTLVSIGWVLGKVPRRRGDFVLFGACAIAMVVEVALITLQQWRGVASHFNRDTPFDAAVLAWIGWLILFVCLVIFDLNRRTFGELKATDDMQVAIRGGMSLLSFSCLLGFALVAYGDYRVSLGESPEVFGAAGVMKFPHGVPMHAIQFIPALCWLMHRCGIDVTRRKQAATHLLFALVLATVFSLVQTCSGRARFDITPASACVLALTFAVLARGAYVVIAPFPRRRRGDAAHTRV